MKKFSDFGIKVELATFVGDKVKMNKILNKEIIIHAYKIEDSKFGGGGKKCLHMQITIDQEKHVVFTGSSALMDMIQQVPQENFPFTTTIKHNDRLEFT